uniref:CD9 antigen-like isoform X1 n=2 Tax=Myxine glutinosa TaxID=7769 RepID=UPI00358F1ABF
MTLLDDVYGGGYSTFYIVLFILIGSGVFTILVLCLGCCASNIRSRCMLASVFTCLLVMFLAEIVLGIWAFLNKEQVSKGLKAFYDSVYSEYWKARSSFSKIIIIMIHTMLDCCGSNAWFAVVETFVNDVCPNEMGVVSIILNAQKDCHTRIDQTTPTFMLIMAGVGVGIGVFLILGMVLSLRRCCAIRKNQQFVIYQQSVAGGCGNPPWTMYSGSSSHVQESLPLNPLVPSELK